MQFYNGYSPAERAAFGQALKDRWRRGEGPLPEPPCQICGATDVPVSFHVEDYSIPYRWTPPAVYSICRGCHVRLHQRFVRNRAWLRFLEHLRHTRQSIPVPERWWERLTQDPASLHSPQARPRP